jgi:archaemetzincin
MKNLITILLFLIITPSFSQNVKQVKTKVIYIQPLGDVNYSCVYEVKKTLEMFYGVKVNVKTKLEFTDDILSPSKTRYDAGKILRKYDSNDVLLILTEKDITHRKDENPEWGIFGLGFCPGKTCVISTFRLRKNVNQEKMIERLTKVAVHEIGHNMGLDHCINNNECLMNDAGGTIKQVDSEKIWFCDKCRNRLK